jgi:methionyl-tRNA formyltransferase
MKAVVFAYHNMGIVGLDALKRERFDIEAIFSHQDDPGENCWFGSVVEWAKENAVRVFCPEDVNTTEWIEAIRKMSPDVIFSFYYRRLLQKQILSIPPSGAYNLHGSLLPAYRGRAPVNWVLVNGEKRTGVTLHYMVEKADAGDIVGQKEVAIEFEDTALTLYKKICTKAMELLGEMLPLVKQGKPPRTAQDLRMGSYFGGRTPQDGRIDWRWPAMRIYNLIRAVTEPYPGAFTYLPEGEKMLVWWGIPDEDRGSRSDVGTMEIEHSDVYVKASEGRIRLMEIEVEKKRLMGSVILNYFRGREDLFLK